MQFIDVRDLANWIVALAARRRGGVFNATGFTVPFEELLAGCRRVTESDATLTWVASDWLLAAGLEEWMGVPLWIASPGWEAANRVVVSRAVGAGLTFRTLDETIRGALVDASTVDGVGLTPQREATLLEEWNGR